LARDGHSCDSATISLLFAKRYRDCRTGHWTVYCRISYYHG
jgi:hypothetical protein